MLAIKAFHDMTYVALFGGTGDELRDRLGLPQGDTEDDDSLCDNMGIEALEALSHTHVRQSACIRAHPELSQWQLLPLLKGIAVEEGQKLRRLCAFKGVDPLTGLPTSERVQ